jgi:hypothetical protein
MYRMRPAINLLEKYHELDRQEIFFSDLKSLNDPMEGFMKFFWKGDKIVWKNFLKHYLLCLEQVLVIASLVEDEKTVSIDDIPVFKTIEDFPTPRYREGFASICTSFLEKASVKRYLEFLCRRGTPINSEELVCHLKNLHLLALDSILQTHKDLGFSKTDIPKEFSSINFTDMIDVWENNREEIEKDPNLVNALYGAQLHVHQQMALILAYNQHEESRSQIKRFLLFEFTEAFVTRVRELAYPHAYVACFLADCSDPSLWGYYADGHKGVCLKFRDSTGPDVNRLSLNTIVGWGSGPIRGNQEFSVQKVRYSASFPPIDFFRSLGSLPLANLDKYWYSDGSGKQSVCAEQFASEKKRQKWHERYWKQHSKCLTVKLPGWKKEKESRIVLADFMRSYVEDEQRKLRYDFNDLEGIIFGYKTSIDDKIKIIKIVERKCEDLKRNDFNFYQAEPDERTGKMRISKLDLLRMQPSNI